MDHTTPLLAVRSVTKSFGSLVALRGIELSIAPGEWIAIVGPSMGGGFALAYALSRPERVGALVLISPSVYRIPDEEKEKLSKLEKPVLLVWGDRDRVFPFDEYGKPLKETLPPAKLVIVEQAGHGVYLDKPNEFNELLVDFLSEAISSRGESH